MKRFCWNFLSFPFLGQTIKAIIASDYKDFDASLIITLYDYDGHYQANNRFFKGLKMKLLKTHFESIY